MTKEDIKIIEEQIKNNNLVFQTIEGLKVAPIKDFCKQNVNSILYDLNRDECTTYSLNNGRAINDIAVAQVIRHLHKLAFPHMYEDS